MVLLTPSNIFSKRYRILLKVFTFKFYYCFQFFPMINVFLTHFMISIIAKKGFLTIHVNLFSMFLNRNSERNPRRRIRQRHVRQSLWRIWRVDLRWVASICLAGDILLYA